MLLRLRPLMLARSHIIMLYCSCPFLPLFKGLRPPAAGPPRQLACFQESSFQDLGGSLIRGSEGFEGSIIRILLGSDALGSLILCILRGSEALRRSIICILCVPEAPGAQYWNSGGLEAAILDTFITSGGLEPSPRETSSSGIS